MNARLKWRIAVRDSDLNPTAKLVAFTLDTFMNGKGVAWPSRASLARGACCSSVRTVDGAMKRLEAAGFVHVIRTQGRRANTYYAVIPNGASDSTVADVPTAQIQTPTAQLGASNGAPGCALSSKEDVTRRRTRGEEETKDPAVLELAHQWLNSHRIR